MTEAVTLTVTRYYREAGTPKVEAVIWKWIAGNPAESLHAAGGVPVDPGMAARARLLPAEHDPGLIPNRWVWVAANDPAAKLPRPSETIRSEMPTADGSIQERVEHVHAADGPYWDYYRLPLRAGVELIDEEVWRAEMGALAAQKAADDEARKAALVEAKQQRDAHKATARGKLSALGLTDDEVNAIIGG